MDKTLNWGASVQFNSDGFQGILFLIFSDLYTWHISKHTYSFNFLECGKSGLYLCHVQ